jgi:ADP-ribosylation factor-like protein 1
MGTWFSSVWEKIFSTNREMKLLMVGLDAAGKSTILYRMRTNELINPKPTIGFNLEEIKIKNVSIKVWDLSG